MVACTQDILVVGELYIVPTTGGVVLQDAFGIAANQNLIDSDDLTSEITLYVPLYPKTVKSLEMYQIAVGYADVVNADDLGDLWLLNGKSGVAPIGFNQTRKLVWDNAGTSIPETVIGAAPKLYAGDDDRLPVSILLEDPGKLYFATNWDTLLIDVDAGTEYFFIRVLGKQLFAPAAYQ